MAHPEGSSFVRWQAATVTQLGYTINLILSLATASLGFTLTLVKDNAFTLGYGGKTLLLISIVLLLFSIAFGIWCAITRLRDFRKTMHNARDREHWERSGEDPEHIHAKLKHRRGETNKLGKLTWEIFYWQIGTFAAGILTLVGAFAAAYKTKLF